MDPWYPLGTADMLDAAYMGLHVGMMTGRDAMAECFHSVTGAPARILGLENYGVSAGCNADFVILQASDTVEAIRRRANRLYVLRRGEIIAEQAPCVSRLNLPERPCSVDFTIRDRE